MQPMNDYPTFNKGHWHRIPKILRPLCLVPASMSWAFDQSKIFYSGDHQFIGRIYAFEYFYLMELHSGSWYIRIGQLT